MSYKNKPEIPKETLVQKNRIACDFYKQSLEGSEAQKYLIDERGLTKEAIEKFELGVAPKGVTPLAKAFPGYFPSKNGSEESAVERDALKAVGLVKNFKANPKGNEIISDRDGNPLEIKTKDQSYSIKELSESQIEELGGLNFSWRKKDAFSNRVMFPIKGTDGSVLGFSARTFDPDEPKFSAKYVNTSETAIFKKGELLYGEYENQDSIKKEGKAIVVEGQMDVVSLWQASLPFAIAAMGTAFNDENIPKLLSVASKLTFSFDGDNAGKRAALKAFNGLLPHLPNFDQVNFLTLPGGEDPDSFIKKRGRGAFIQEWDRAPNIIEYFYQSICEREDLDEVEGASAAADEVEKAVSAISDKSLKREFLERLIKLDNRLEAPLSSSLKKFSQGKGDRLANRSGVVRTSVADQQKKPSAEPGNKTSAQEVRREFRKEYPRKVDSGITSSKVPPVIARKAEAKASSKPSEKENKFLFSREEEVVIFEGIDRGYQIAPLKNAVKFIVSNSSKLISNKLKEEVSSVEAIVPEPPEIDERLRKIIAEKILPEIETHIHFTVENLGKINNAEKVYRFLFSNLKDLKDLVFNSPDCTRSLITENKNQTRSRQP